MVAEGPLARVYRARPSEASPQQSPAYSLKMLRKEWQEDPKAVASLHCEAEAGRSVANPHLIPVLAARLSGPPYYLVMPWLEGRTLGAHLASPASLDLPMVLWIVRQVAEGLAAMDDAGWVHGDVKPANIFVSPDGHATLLDLGFARRPGQSGSIADRCVLGTCSYMAPEVMTSALGADIRSDLYSLGVVLFEALAGRLPFTGNTLSQMVEQHKQARPPLLRRLRPAVPTGVADLVAALLSKQPLRRPQTPRELIRRLVELEIETFAERASSPGA
ncbi:MAG: serine/threonine protein kinase [Rhodopirellula sp.]|nr:serine/threonine protein kinase [Rhodopirellula sp.]